MYVYVYVYIYRVNPQRAELLVGLVTYISLSLSI